MPTKTAEFVLRDDLKKAMSGLWLMTWHEDREINPGVPDISYVMLGGNYETGWLELKAVTEMEISRAGKVRFHVEPSQHQWISRHDQKIPIHFLCAVGERCFLLHGSAHELIDRPLRVDELHSAAIIMIPKAALRQELPSVLKKLTSRDR